ncbi:hypothetical protein CHS0354_038697 [Potamilus streckersoni]|uniref:C2H2-type domain-containing protein n=1 Tax=Potamilus streckersoni TaxID=2493646 RepID=A0AAE0SF59_9BIVA|nr:hypothetical protein CHS0354_038697 [Potamilus streckersoni]
MESRYQAANTPPISQIQSEKSQSASQTQPQPQFSQSQMAVHFYRNAELNQDDSQFEIRPHASKELYRISSIDQALSPAVERLFASQEKMSAISHYEDQQMLQTEISRPLRLHTKTESLTFSQFPELSHTGNTERYKQSDSVSSQMSSPKSSHQASSSSGSFHSFSHEKVTQTSMAQSTLIQGEQGSHPETQNTHKSSTKDVANVMVPGISSTSSDSVLHPNNKEGQNPLPRGRGRRRNSVQGPGTDHSPVSSDRQHACTVCFRTFRNKPQLIQHSLVHSGIRKHICTYCDRTFKQLCHLQQHLRTHTGERPYRCSEPGCKRAFAQLSNLQHHQRNHDEQVKKEASKNYHCVVCERSYTNESSLKAHTLKMHIHIKTVDPTVPSKPKKKRLKKQKDFSSLSPVVAVPSSSDEEKGLSIQKEGSVERSFGQQEGFTTEMMGNISRPSSRVNFPNAAQDVSQQLLEKSGQSFTHETIEFSQSQTVPAQTGLQHVLSSQSQSVLHSELQVVHPTVTSHSSQSGLSIVSQAGSHLVSQTDSQSVSQSIFSPHDIGLRAGPGILQHGHSSVVPVSNASGGHIIGYCPVTMPHLCSPDMRHFHNAGSASKC